MNRTKLDNYITEAYGAKGEFLWQSQPTFAVYRHETGKKWFAVVMELSGDKIGIEKDKRVEVVNLKCDPMLIGAVTNEEGIHRGYHMNKNHWITVRLDGSVDEDKIKWLLGLSFDMTKKRRK